MGADSADHVFTLVETINDTGKSGTIDGGCEELLAGDEDGEQSVASVEDQLRKEMTVYEVYHLSSFFFLLHINGSRMYLFLIHSLISGQHVNTQSFSFLKSCFWCILMIMVALVFKLLSCINIMIK